MTVTLNMLIDKLEACEIAGKACGDAGARDGTWGYELAVPVTDAVEDAVCEMRAWGHGLVDTLFVESAQACEKLVHEHPQATCVAVDGKSVERAAMIASNLALSLSSWQLEVQRVIAEGGSFQDLMDVCERLTDNPLVLSDAAFRIIAYTRSAIPNVPFVREAIERGAFDNQTMQLFRTRKRPTAWDGSQGINVLDEANDERPYPVISYVFRVNGHYFMHLVMHCAPQELGEGLRDTFSMIVDAIDALIRKTSPETGLFEQGVAKALADAASGMRPLALKRSDREMLVRAGFAHGTPMRLAVCDMGYGEEDHQLPGFAASRLSQRFPGAFVFVCGTNVAMLAAETTGRPAFEGREKLARMLASAMDNQMVRCGLSDAFNSLDDLRHAYQQGEAASAMAVGDMRVATFHDAFTRYALRFDRDEMLLEWCVRRSVPGILREEAVGADEDAAADESDFVLLRRFLEGERRATTVAEETHLHRTSLLYRIKRIERRFGVDLNDVATRRRILMEYDLLDNESTG